MKVQKSDSNCVLRRVHLTQVLSAILTLMVVNPATAASITATHRIPSASAGGATFSIPIGIGSNPSALTTPAIVQTFKAEVGGSLLSVAVSAASVDQNSTGFQLAVTKLQNGQPAEILAISPLQGLSINGRLNDITVPNAVAQFGESGVLLQAQQRYGLLFIADRRPSNFYVFGFQTSDVARQYAAGEILRSVNGASFQSFPPISDLAFAVSVQAIPEPSMLTLTFIAIAAIRVRVHRH